MSNYWPPRIVDLAGLPAAALNPLGPWAFNAHAAFPLTSTGYTNLLAAAVPNAFNQWPLWESGDAGGTPTVITTGTFAPYLHFDAPAPVNYLRLQSPVGAALGPYKLWTLGLVFCDDTAADTYAQNFFNSGRNYWTGLGLSIARQVGAQNLIVGCNTVSLTFANTEWNRNDWNVLLMWGSPTTLQAAINQYSNLKSTAADAQWQIEDGRVAVMNGAPAPSGANQRCKLAGLVLWQGWLPQAEAEQFFYDPQLIFRGLCCDEINGFANWAGTPITRPTASDFRVSCTTGPGTGGNLASGDLLSRVVVGKDPYNLDPATAQVVTSGSILQTEVNKDVGHAVNTLDAESLYAVRHETSPDAGTTWIPTAGGTQFVQTGDILLVTA